MPSLSKILVGAVVVSGLAMGTSLAATPTFKLVTKIRLPTKPGHGDMVEYDPAGFVYVSMPDGGAVIDVHTNKVIHTYKLESPNDNAFDSGYVYWTDAPGANKPNYIVVISKKTWKVVNKIETQGTTPDGLQVDPAANKLYVMSDDDNWVEVYDISNGESPKFEAKWMLYPPTPPGSGPDVGVVAPSLHLLFMPDDSWEEALSTKTGAIMALTNTEVPVTKKGGTKGQFYWPKTNQLWVGTTTAKGGMLVMNPTTLKIEARLKESGEVDQVTADPKLGLLYAFESPAKGFGVFDLNTTKYLTFVKYGTTITHTGAVDTANHDIYINAGGAAEVLVYKPVM